MSVVRFALVHQDTGKVESGANYPGCSKDNPNACDPRSFDSLADASTYATQNGERLYVVGYALPNTPQWSSLLDQVWNYVSNPNLIPPPAPGSITSPISGNTALVVGAGILVGFFLLK